MNFPEWDRELFVFLNSKNLSWLDPIMIFLSSYTGWFIVAICICAFMIYKNRKEGKIASVFLIGGVIVTLVLNNIIKLFIMRPRPGNEQLIKDIINQLEHVGQSYSFFSAHTSSSICLAMFTTLYFKNKLYGIAVFLWAFLVAYSRIYVGKHYPLDILVGLFFGLLMGWLSYYYYSKYEKKKAPMV